MQDKFRLYRRPNGMFYAEEYQTRHRESLQTKDGAEARRLIAAKNQAATQPVFNLEMAKVYLKAHDPQFCERCTQPNRIRRISRPLFAWPSTGALPR
jgi:hypothetical protein